MIQNRIPIFLASDEKYVKYMTVAITSILSNTKSYINFYILDGGISDFSKNKIEELKTQFKNFSIEYLKINIEKFNNFPNIGHFSLNMYFRYLISSLKPEIKKALYIDSDMIINGDIKELFLINLDNKPIAAVPYLHENITYKRTSEYRWTQKVKKKLDLEQSHNYFNSGMLIMDLEFFRKNRIQEKLFELTNQLGDKLECPDQDILNICFENNYKILEDKYNIIVDLTLNLAPKKLKTAFVLHFTGCRCRPWLKSNCVESEKFWNYANKTPFCNELRWELLFNELEYTNNLINIKSNKNKYLYNKFMSKVTFGKVKNIFKTELIKYKTKIKTI